MNQHKYNITYCNPRKNRKNRKNKKPRKNKNPQKGGLKLDNEASFHEMFPEGSLGRRAMDYFQTTDFKKDFKQLMSLSKPATVLNPACSKPFDNPPHPQNKSIAVSFFFCFLLI